METLSQAELRKSLNWESGARERTQVGFLGSEGTHQPYTTPFNYCLNLAPSASKLYLRISGSTATF